MIQNLLPDEVKYSEQTGSLFLRFGWAPGIKLTISAGQTFQRRYDTFRDGEQTREIKLKNSAVYGIRLAFVLR
ncbi:MAG: hypothetical protein ACI86H_000949 [bacterium]|jgi:hypothetical protein